jgi:hypothetical protein
MIEKVSAYIFIGISVFLFILTQRIIPFLSVGELNMAKAVFPVGEFHPQKSFTTALTVLTQELGEVGSDCLTIAFFSLLLFMVLYFTHQTNPTAMLLTISLMMGGIADWQSTMFVQTGAIRNLYAMVIALAFLILFFGEEQSKAHKAWILLRRIVSIALGILCGVSSLSIGPAIGLMTMIVLINKIHQKIRVTIGQIAASIGCILSALLSSIGAAVTAIQNSSGDTFLIRHELFLRGFESVALIFQNLFFLIILLLCFAAFHKGSQLDQKSERNRSLILVAVISCITNIFLVSAGEGSTFCAYVLLMCVFVSKVGQLREIGYRLRLWSDLLIVFLWLRGIYVYLDYLAASPDFHLFRHS